MSVAGSRNAGLGLALLLIAGGVWLMARGRSEAGPIEGVPAPSAPTAAGQPAPKGIDSAVAEVPPPATVKPIPPAKAEHHVRYPEGVQLPALNGVTADVTLNWGQGPFTPVVGVVDGPGGWQWYVHENGAHSTVAMVPMNGVPQAMGFVAEPTQPLPTADAVQQAAEAGSGHR